ncbi:MAG: hypothetical protein ABW215_16690 [Kibdelosporangium sp.]
MTGVKINPESVASYAKTVAESADELDPPAKALSGAPLGAEAFGDLGRQVHTAEAYARASATLREQLTRAIETLNSASASLKQVAERYQGSDEDNVQKIKRAENPR